MNTITRLLESDKVDGNIWKRGVRFDDYHHMHVTDNKRKSVMYYLRRAREKDRGIQAIILYDLGINCITDELLKGVAAFARRGRPEDRISLFIDPAIGEFGDKRKYRNINGTAILPNFAEWWHLAINQDHDQLQPAQGTSKAWREGIPKDDKTTVADIIRYSLYRLRGFQFHVITCDQDGVLLIASHPDKKHRVAAYRIKSNLVRGPVNRQLGPGDVLTAAFAALLGDFKRKDLDTRAALTALYGATAAVECYLGERQWHHMPSLKTIQARIGDNAAPKIEALLDHPITDIADGIRYLPTENKITLSKFETTITGAYTQSKAHRQRLVNLVDDVKSCCTGGKKHGVRLGAGGGSGKSLIADGLCDVFTKDGKKVLRISEEFERSEELERLKKVGAKNYFGAARSDLNIPLDTGLLLIVDEALKRSPEGYLIQVINAHDLLDTAGSANAALFLVSSEFADPSSLSEPPRDYVVKEVLSRCSENKHYLPPLAGGPSDIPLISAAYILTGRYLENRRVPRESVKTPTVVMFEGDLLVALTNLVLWENSPSCRAVTGWMDRCVESAELRMATRANSDKNELDLTLADLLSCPEAKDRERDIRSGIEGLPDFSFRLS